MVPQHPQRDDLGWDLVHWDWQLRQRDAADTGMCARLDRAIAAALRRVGRLVRRA